MEYLFLLVAAVGVVAYVWNKARSDDSDDNAWKLLDPTEPQKEFLADLCQIHTRHGRRTATTTSTSERNSGKFSLARKPRSSGPMAPTP